MLVFILKRPVLMAQKTPVKQNCNNFVTKV